MCTQKHIGAPGKSHRDDREIITVSCSDVYRIAAVTAITHTHKHMYICVCIIYYMKWSAGGRGSPWRLTERPSAAAAATVIVRLHRRPTISKEKNRVSAFSPDIYHFYTIRCKKPNKSILVGKRVETFSFINNTCSRLVYTYLPSSIYSKHRLLQIPKTQLTIKYRINHDSSDS